MISVVAQKSLVGSVELSYDTGHIRLRLLFSSWRGNDELDNRSGYLYL
jgi:hypothetical protein